jgi:tRNA (mo5U34)-methyltransferase
MPSLPIEADDPRLSGWYHTIELGHGLVTRGVYDHRPIVGHYGIPESLEGKTCLDVGTADGFFAFEMERRGAARVVAIDLASIGDCDWVPRMKVRVGGVASDHSWPSRFHLAKAMLGSQVEHRFCSVYELSPYTVGRFDVVFCGSLLLHLQNPLQALINIRSVTDEMAVIETTVDRELEERSPGEPLMLFGSPDKEAEPGEHNVHWRFTTAALERMLLYADFAGTATQGLFELSPTGPTGSAVVAYVDPSFVTPRPQE